MKTIFNYSWLAGILSAGLILAAGCSKSEEPLNSENKKVQVKMNVSLPSESETKVYYSEEANPGEAWSVVWTKEDALGGFSWSGTPSGAISFDKFSMSTLTDSKNATFSGTVGASATSLRLVYPYDNKANAISAGKYHLDLSGQSVNMNDPYTCLGNNSPLVGNIISSPTSSVANASMSHICTYIRVQLKFSNLPESSKLVGIELSSERLYQSADLDLTKEISGDAFISNYTAGVISVPIVNSGTLVAEDIYSIPIAAFPTTFTSSTPVTLTAYISSGGVIYKNTTAFSIAPATDITFQRAKYNYLNFNCNMTARTEVSVNWNSDVAAAFAGGSGISADPWLISTPQQLAYLASLVNGGANQSGVYFKLTNDIDLSGKEWSPIGTTTGGKYFAGYFDGNGKNVSGLFYYEGGTGGAGLFGRITSTAIIKNTHVDGSLTATTITSAGASVAGIVGYNVGGKIINCSFSGDVTAFSNAGGIVGYSEGAGRIINCYNTGTVRATGSGAYVSGGIVGYRKSTTIIKNCYNTGNVLGNSRQAICCGSSSTYLTNCYSLSGSCSHNDNATVMSQEQMEAPDFLATLNNNALVLYNNGETEIRAWRTWKLPIHSDLAPSISYYDLSSTTSANCYIVSSAGNYRFKATVKGNNVTVGSYTANTITPVSAKLMWQDYYSDGKGLVNNVYLYNGYVYFTTPTQWHGGNALITVSDASNTILWSWHLWFTETPSEHIYKNNEGTVINTVMDRNLGAVSAVRGTTDEDLIKTYGLMYQWGRKDPNLSANGTTGSGFFGSCKTTYDINGNAITASNSSQSSYNNSGWYAVNNGTKTLDMCTQYPTNILIGNLSWHQDQSWGYSTDLASS